MNTPSVESIHDEFLRQLHAYEGFGLERPPSISVGEYLRTLAECSVLEQGIAETGIAIFQQLRFAAILPDSSPVAKFFTELQQSAHRINSLTPEEKEKLKKRFGEFWVLKDEKPTEPLHDVENVERTAPLDCLPRSDATSQIAVRPRTRGYDPTRSENKRAHTSLKVVVIFGWSLLCIGFGYTSDEFFDGLVKKIAPSKIPFVKKAENRKQTEQESLRILTAETPDERIKLAISLAQRFINKGDFENAEFAYRLALVKNPDNPTINNSLAWLFLTARDKKVRRPREALYLAKRAYSKSQTAYIIDTLAEAHFQNGNVTEAIRFQKKAISQNPRDIEVYRKRLKKFEDAK